MAKPADVTGWGKEIIELDEDSDLKWNRWPGRANAPSIVGIDRARFRELVKTGRVQEYRVSDGSIRYDPRDLTALSDEFAFEEETENPSFAVAGVQIEGMKTANDVLKLQMGINERLIALVIGNQEASTKALVATIESQNKALEFYQKERLAYIREQGETKLQELALGIEANERDAKEQRRQMLIGAIAPHVPTLLSAITESIRTGGDKPADPWTDDPRSDPANDKPASPKTELGTLAERLLRSVGPEKLELLKLSGMLHDEDSEMLDQIIGEMGSAESSPTTESE